MVTEHRAEERQQLRMGTAFVQREREQRGCEAKSQAAQNEVILEVHFSSQFQFLIFNFQSLPCEPAKNSLLEFLTDYR
jgi:hypothetical protein